MPDRILIVEDEANIAESLSFILERAGFDVSLERDGAAALARVDELRPALVILDVMLPNLSGFDVLRALRSATENVPVMMLTAKGQAKDRAEAEALGVDMFMTKPFSNAEIVAAVQNLTGGAA